MGAWLSKLSLGSYAAAFAKEEVDGSVLPDLSEDDLKHYVSTG